MKFENIKQLEKELKRIRIKINIVSEKTEKENKKFFLLPSKAGLLLHEWNKLSNERDTLIAKLLQLQQVCEEIKKMPIHKREIKQTKESTIIINSIDKDELLKKFQGEEK